MKTAVTRSRRVQQSGSGGDPRIDGRIAVSVCFALAADLLIAAAKVAEGLVTVSAVLPSEAAHSALTARFPVFDQAFIDIADATPAGRVRAAADRAILASSVRQRLARLPHVAMMLPADLGHCEPTEEQ